MLFRSVYDFREVSAKLGEMVTYCEVWGHAMEGLEHQAGPTPTGQWTLGPGRGLHIWFAQISGRMTELLREICGSGIIMQPSENDLANIWGGNALRLLRQAEAKSAERASR